MKPYHIRKIIIETSLGALFILFCLSLMAEAEAFAVENEQDSLVVRQLVDIDGTSEIEVLLNGEKVAVSIILEKFNNTISIFIDDVAVIPANANKTEILKLMRKKYITDGKFADVLGERAAVLAAEAGVSGAVIQLEQQVSVYYQELNEFRPGKAVISGYAFVNATGESEVLHRDVILTTEGVYIKAHYFPQVAISDFYLPNEKLSLVISEALLTVDVPISNALVYQVYNSSDDTIGSPLITLKGYNINISLNGVVNSQSETVSYTFPATAEAECVAGISLSLIVRKKTTNTNSGSTTLSITEEECPRSSWGSGATAPSSVIDLIEQYQADYALLFENTNVPVASVTLVARQLDYSCFHGSYREVFDGNIKLTGDQNVYYILGDKGAALTPIGTKNDALSLGNINLNTTTVTVTHYGDSLVFLQPDGSTVKKLIQRLDTDAALEKTETDLSSMRYSEGIMVTVTTALPPLSISHGGDDHLGTPSPSVPYTGSGDTLGIYTPDDSSLPINPSYICLKSNKDRDKMLLYCMLYGRECNGLGG